ncbi:Ger(x)C family spore germination protein [Halobacillus yeomjeoni]|uniref:Ger(X)C family spore germination protein n=1 Tax=Halobacillus yeomjeoni TaxID=311194 RepID=A0A931MVA5_9BACI|nr:Ger(x)C family spore germination protein [Halobacillus yeomjeoni]MBH0230385.1 Ger(x)C family spore germination protein [Halobacillus yeomjeoni]
MMKKCFKRIIPIILVIVSLLILTGCWNSRELDELGIAVATGIDKNDEGDYIIIVQVINPSEIATDAPTTRPPVSSYTITGKSMFEAFRKLTTKSPRKIYFSQMRLVVIGERLAEEGLMPTLDFLYRDHEFRTSFYVALAKGESVEKMLSVITPYEKIPANKIMNSIKASEEAWASTKGSTIDKVLSALRSPGENPVIGGIELIGADYPLGDNKMNVEHVDAPTKVELDHLAAFKEDRLAGWLTEDQSRGLNFATGDVRSTILHVACKEKGTIGIEIIRTKAGMTGKTNGSSPPKLEISVETEANVGEVACDMDLSNPDTIDYLNKETEKEIKKLIESAVTAAKEDFESDILGAGNVFHRDEPRYWKKVEKEWDEHFKEMDCDIKVQADIRRKGNTTQPIDKKG